MSFYGNLQREEKLALLFFFFLLIPHIWLINIDSFKDQSGVSFNETMQGREKTYEEEEKLHFQGGEKITRRRRIT